MDTVIFLRTLFWIGFIAAFVGIVLFIEIGSRLVSRFKTRSNKTDDTTSEQLSLFQDSEMLSTG